MQPGSSLCLITRVSVGVVNGCQSSRVAAMGGDCFTGEGETEASYSAWVNCGLAPRCVLSHAARHRPRCNDMDIKERTAFSTHKKIRHAFALVLAMQRYQHQAWFCLVQFPSHFALTKQMIPSASLLNYSNKVIVCVCLLFPTAFKCRCVKVYDKPCYNGYRCGRVSGLVPIPSTHQWDT